MLNYLKTIIYIHIGNLFIKYFFGELSEQIYV
jgi:hypothetical protein